MKYPLFIADGSQLLVMYLAVLAAVCMLGLLALWLAWRRKRLVAGILCALSLALDAAIAPEFHMLGVLPFTISLAAVVVVLFRSSAAASEKEPIQPPETTRGK